MRKLLLTTLFAVIVLSASAQKMVEFYSKGTVKLVPDAGYAQSNNWDYVFRTYFDTISRESIGKKKSLVVMPDGAVIVNNPYCDYYTRFTPDGRFEKEFEIRDNNKSGVKRTNSIKGVLNGKILFSGLDKMGNMICTDLDGNHLKTIKLDYMGKQYIALSDNKIAVVGFVIWKDKVRDFVSIVDFNTGKEKIVWDHFTDWTDFPEKDRLFSYSYKFKDKGGFVCNTMPFTSLLSVPPIISSVDTKLVVAVPGSGEILVYNLEGELVERDKTVWASNYVSVAEQTEIHKKAIEKYRKLAQDPKQTRSEEMREAIKEIVKKMEADLPRITDPIILPSISTVIPDSDGNLLFFEYPKEGNANKFNVWIYENGGKFVCQCTFVCDDYDLVINPEKLVFHNGYVYGLQALKKSNGVPLRLVRFQLTSN